MRYREILEYREGPGGAFTHDGARFDLDMALAAAETVVIQEFKVADLDAPILVTNWHEKLTTIDGLHRLAKAFREGRPTIKGKLLTILQLGRPVLAEGADAPLYHFTTIWNLFKLMAADTLGKADGGLSLTRDSRMPFKSGYDVVLVLDQRRIRQRYRLTPSYGDSRGTDLVDPHDESEERLSKPLAPLSRYLREIIIPSRLAAEVAEIEPVFDKAERTENEARKLSIFHDAATFLAYVREHRIPFRTRVQGDAAWARRGTAAVHREARERPLPSQPSRRISSDMSLAEHSTIDTPSSDGLLFEMAGIRSDRSGLPFYVWASPKAGSKHDVRVKVSPSFKYNRSEEAVVALRPTIRIVEGKMDSKQFALLSRWIELNWDALIEFWDENIDQDDFFSRLQKL